MEGEIPLTLANEAALRRALEIAGIDFIEEDESGREYDFGSRKRARQQKRLAAGRHPNKLI